MARASGGLLETADIVVAGGSTAALAAAITAATAAPDKVVLLTDPTNWLGGQLTASGVSAIDFGELNRIPANQDRRFRDLMRTMGAPANPGGCWVSTMCYEPQNLVDRWITPTVAALPNLVISLNTVITGIEPCGRDSDHPAAPDPGGQICALTVVRRRPRVGGAGAGWSHLLSDAIADWYSPIPSTTFTKEAIRLEAAVFIEATEWGDVLLTGAGTASSTLVYCFGPFLAHFSSSTPSHTRRAKGSTWCPCLSGADWCLQSDGVLPHSRPQGIPG